jgi:hypothetical protein
VVFVPDDRHDFFLAPLRLCGKYSDLRLRRSRD